MSRTMSMGVTFQVADDTTVGELRRHVHSLLRPELGTEPELGTKATLISVHRPVVDETDLHLI